ncbi:glycosyltransferase [Streptomyces sp. NPDC059460]|uniref:glycosyltransferase n=1 Tax=Streptomyces sp. NPDC059460 TaxID=3346840 RepID=UPI0036C0BA56
MKIAFLIHNVYGIGGTIRTTLNLASALTDHHEVTVVRLVRAKRFDLLIEAFTKVAAQRPGWSLRIYGTGTDKDRLQELINDRGLAGRA